MEFTKEVTIYFDIDYLFNECLEEKIFETEDIKELVEDYTVTWDDVDYYLIEGWMIDSVVSELKKRLDKELSK